MNTQNNLGTAVVTGAAGGIGSLYVHGLAERGYDLLLVGRSQAPLQALADDVAKASGRKVSIAVHDLSDAADLKTLGSRLAEATDVSLLANLASQETFSPFTKITAADIDKTIAVNVTAVTHLSRAVAPGFAERGRGTIINFASVLSFHPWGEFNVYNGTKAFVIMFSQSLQAELRGKGVLVQVVAPAATATPFWNKAGLPYENLPAQAVMKAEDLVQASLKALDKKEEWVFPSLPDATVWDAYEAARGKLVGGMMNGTPAKRYTEA